jgi:hypothetical protein
MPKWKPYYALDLAGTAYLPTGWQEDVRSVVRECGINTILTGAGSTSRERRADRIIPVRVADGCAIKMHLPWLWNLYNGVLKEFCATSFRKPIFVANLLHTTININQLMGRGAQCEWHVDSNPVTGVLFVTDSDQGLGGSLVFKDDLGRRAVVRPKAGMFVCFDARQIPHRVSPLRRDGERISLPMNYYDSATDQPRPPDLDNQIYTPVEQQ